jgi:hypothetical protein
MAQAKKKTEITPPKPEGRPTLLSLVRVEERQERIPITAEQAQERFRVAAATIAEAQSLDRQASSLSTDARRAKKAAEAKHAEADQITLDAQNGTVLAPYPVIVERHPQHPTEMLTWRVPDGVAAAELLEVPLVPGEDHITQREAQGCALLETRAMSPEELEAARVEDDKRKNPELPIDEKAGEKAAASGDEVPERPETMPNWVKQLNDKGWPLCPGCGGDTLRSMGVPPKMAHIIGCEAEGCTWRAPKVDELLEGGGGDAKPEKKGARPCPIVVAEGDTPAGDKVCGAQPGRGGYCGEHRNASKESKVKAVARRSQREAAPPPLNGAQGNHAEASV